MSEEKLKTEAMRRYEQGESPKNIYTSLGKGKTWFFKWLKRFKSGYPDWANEQSRKPHNSPKKIDQQMEQTVIATREQLVNTLYAPIGAQHICWELQQTANKTPSLATVNRVIKRNGLSRKRPRYQSKGVKYPVFPVVNASNILHQMDGVGPRYLKNDGRFYAINVIDAYDRRVRVNPKRRQNKDALVVVMLRSWECLGLPNFLQLDNTLSAQGSRRHPHSFGLVIRLCLHLGIQPIFIPIREPWRNGIIERFNDDFDKRFFRSQFFKNLQHVCDQAINYEIFHDTKHRYSTLNGHTPEQHYNGVKRTLPDNFKIPVKLAIASGHVHLIRFIRSNRILDIFGEKFPMPIDVEYEYVRATIDTSKEKLVIYHDDQIVKELDYPLPKTAMDLSELEL
jgi:transposase InsO family protein